MTTRWDYKDANAGVLDIDGCSRGLYSGEARPSSDGDTEHYVVDVYTVSWAYHGTLDSPRAWAAFKARLQADA